MPTRRDLHGWTPLDSDIRLAGGEAKLWGTHLSRGFERERCFALWNQNELRAPAPQWPQGG